MAFPVETLAALLGRTTGMGESSSMSDVFGVASADGLLLKTGDTPVLGVPKVVEREGVRDCLDLTMVEVQQVCARPKLISLMAWKPKLLNHMT